MFWKEVGHLFFWNRKKKNKNTRDYDTVTMLWQMREEDEEAQQGDSFS